MDLLRSSYLSDSDSDSENEKNEKSKSNNNKTMMMDPSLLRQSVQSKVTAAPYVLPATTSTTLSLIGSSSSSKVRKEEDIVLYHNPKAASLYAPMLGPKNPNSVNVMYDESGQQVTSGVATTHEVDPSAFHRMYHKRRSVRNPLRKSAIVDLGPSKAVQALRRADVDEPAKKKKRVQTKEEKQKMRKEMYLEKGKHDDETSWNSIWAVRDDEDGVSKEEEEHETELSSSKEQSNNKIKAAISVDEEEEEARRQAFKFTKGEGPSVPYSKGVSKSEVRSVFHGDSETDYQGRSWNTPPTDIKPLDEDDQAKMKCFLPKKRVHTYTGHTKGVRKIDIFPKYGHLLLSGSFDSKVKIWDVHRKRRCMRTCMGHSQGVNDVQFSNDGDCFLSSSLDRHIKLWDTETGKCRIDLTNHKIPYCVKFYPENNNLVLAGCSNKKIVQYDCRTGDIVQEYNHHLGPVNTVTFVDENRKFVSTSDDKKVLVWEMNIPVPVKYITDPTMHSIPAVTERPGGKFIVGQSLDNQILTFNSGTRVKPHKKRFSGHINAGFACQIGFSPNGQYLMSGDGDGRLWFWDWKSSKVYRKIRAHNDGPCIGCQWHPIYPSRVFTCGWDGTIKEWE